MAQSFDTEQITALERANETLSEGFSGIVPAFEATIDLAHKHGIPALEREAQEGLEAAHAVVKMQEQLSEALDKMINYYKSLSEALE